MRLKCAVAYFARRVAYILSALTTYIRTLGYSILLLCVLLKSRRRDEEEEEPGTELYRLAAIARRGHALYTFFRSRPSVNAFTSVRKTTKDALVTRERAPGHFRVTFLRFEFTRRQKVSLDAQTRSSAFQATLWMKRECFLYKTTRRFREKVAAVLISIRVNPPRFFCAQFTKKSIRLYKRVHRRKNGDGALIFLRSFEF